MNPPRRSLPDLICLSHLRWDFVFQRPQHLMTRWARHTRVFYVEEPKFDDGPNRMEVSARGEGLDVVVPHLWHGTSAEQALVAQRELLEHLLDQRRIFDFVLWFYTPMALPFTQGLEPRAIVYDCMDELSLFRGAPPELILRERALFEKADLVTTGGHALYRSKRKHHHNVHAFPSSVDAAHFARARTPAADPVDQAGIPGRRIGFYGVIDERMDLELLAGISALRPDWHLILLGPVVKIDPAILPHAPNLHYLGAKSYRELPDYLAGWDVAILPFARNESTRFISPTKTPEYLAAGRPVVSTSVADVAEPYGRLGLAHIADAPADFVAAIERAIAEDPQVRLSAVDAFLSDKSWDATWNQMANLVHDALAARADGGSATRIEPPRRVSSAGGGATIR